MSLTLITADGRRLDVNVWNWGVLHHAVEAAEIFPEEEWAPKRWNGGDDLDAAQVGVLADFLERELLPKLREGERMFFDGTVTAEPDDGTFYRQPDEMWKNYSLRREVLASVIAFLRAAAGPVTFS